MGGGGGASNGFRSERLGFDAKRRRIQPILKHSPQHTERRRGRRRRRRRYQSWELASVSQAGTEGHVVVVPLPSHTHDVTVDGFDVVFDVVIGEEKSAHSEYCEAREEKKTEQEEERVHAGLLHDTTSKVRVAESLVERVAESLADRKEEKLSPRCLLCRCGGGA